MLNTLVLVLLGDGKTEITSITVEEIVTTTNSEQQGKETQLTLSVHKLVINPITTLAYSSFQKLLSTANSHASM